MIYPNFITGPHSAVPLDLNKIALDALAPIPANLKQRAIYTLPRRVVPTGTMEFAYPTATNQPESACVAACAAAGTALSFYVGAKNVSRLTIKQRRSVLEQYRGCDCLIFDQVADDSEDSPEWQLVLQALGLRVSKCVMVEATKDQPHLRRAMEKYGQRFGVFGYFWLWEGLRGRFTTDAVKALGGRPIVGVRDATPDNDEQRWWDERPVEFAQFKVDKTVEWSSEADVSLRFDKTILASATHLAALGSIN